MSTRPSFDLSEASQKFEGLVPEIMNNLGESKCVGKNGTDVESIAVNQPGLVSVATPMETIDQYTVVEDYKGVSVEKESVKIDDFRGHLNGAVDSLATIDEYMRQPQETQE